MHKYILVCSSVQCTLERSIYVCPQSRTQDLYWSQNLICFPSLYFQELPLLLVFLFFWNFWVWDPAIIRHVHPYYGFSAFISKLLSTKVDWFSTNCNSLWNQNHPVCFCMCLFNSQPAGEQVSAGHYKAERANSKPRILIPQASQCEQSAPKAVQLPFWIKLRLS